MLGKCSTTESHPAPWVLLSDRYLPLTALGSVTSKIMALIGWCHMKAFVLITGGFLLCLFVVKSMRSLSDKDIRSIYGGSALIIPSFSQIPPSQYHHLGFQDLNTPIWSSQTFKLQDLLIAKFNHSSATIFTRVWCQTFGNHFFFLLKYFLPYADITFVSLGFLPFIQLFLLSFF